jgi:hypothetical protein
MNLRLDFRSLWRCIFIGLYMPLQGVALHRTSAMLLLPREPRPPLNFIIEVAIFYFVTGFLFALVYFVIKDELPGKKRYTRGLFYGLLVAFGVVFGLFVSIIALDFSGKFDLLTPYKIRAYVVTVFDQINFIIAGMVLGVIADKREIKSNQAKFDRKGLVIASAIGFIAYPAMNFLITILIDPMISLVLDIPKDAVPWFYTGVFVPLAVNGAVIPLFYCLTKDAFAGSWMRKSLMFFLSYYFGYIVISVIFGVPFGFKLQALVNFLIILVVPTFFTVGLTARLQN